MQCVSHPTPRCSRCVEASCSSPEALKLSRLRTALLSWSLQKNRDWTCRFLAPTDPGADLAQSM